jgi:urease accessory protein
MHGESGERACACAERASFHLMSVRAAATPKMAAGESIAPRVRASLRLAFERDDATGTTRLASSVQEPPLRVVRGFTQSDGTALVHLHNVSGGLLGGDSLGLNVVVGAGASAQITTTGATRIYRPSADAAPTSQTTEVAIAEGGLLEYVPDAVIPFADVRYEQRTRIHLAEGAGLFWWEMLAPGREARGEIFEYDSVQVNAEIYARERRVATERIRVQPKEFSPGSRARLGAYRYWATFYICRAGLPQAAWLALEEELRTQALEFAEKGAARWGVSALVSDGVVARCVAMRGRDVISGLHALWKIAKLRLYGREPIAPRKVN